MDDISSPLVLSKEEEERPKAKLAELGTFARQILNTTPRRPCPSRVAPLLRKKGTKKAAIAEVSCRRFSCEVCFPRRCSLWLNSIMIHFEAETELFVIVATTGEFQKIKRLIQSHRGSFVRVNYSDGVLIVTNKPTKFQDRPEDATIALELLSFAMTQIAYKTGKLAVRSSRAWKLGNKRESEFSRMGLIPKNSFSEAIQTLTLDGILASVLHTNDGKLAKFEFPNDWSEAEISAYLLELQGKTANPQTSEQTMMRT